jgi:hypothetical protein
VILLSANEDMKPGAQDRHLLKMLLSNTVKTVTENTIDMTYVSLTKLEKTDILIYDVGEDKTF